jgi:hypothetical protein
MALVDAGLRRGSAFRYGKSCESWRDRHECRFHGVTQQGVVFPGTLQSL